MGGGQSKSYKSNGTRTQQAFEKRTVKRIAGDNWTAEMDRTFDALAAQSHDGKIRLTEAQIQHHFEFLNGKIDSKQLHQRLTDNSSPSTETETASRSASSVLSSCPYSNVEFPVSTDAINSLQGKCPFHAHVPHQTTKLTRAPAIQVSRGTHQTSSGTASLLEDMGGGDRIREACTRFYARAFVDKHLQQFFFLDDGAEAHGKRLADWIIEKMGGEGKPWTESGRYGQRQPSHHQAWNSRKRKPEVRGQHFKLDDARVWMRLHFWAIRECGLGPDKKSGNPNFWEWYVQFIAHFMRVYERKAVPYAPIEAEWSADPATTSKYLETLFMDDVVGFGRDGF